MRQVLSSSFRLRSGLFLVLSFVCGEDCSSFFVTFSMRQVLRYVCGADFSSFVIANCHSEYSRTARQSLCRICIHFRFSQAIEKKINEDSEIFSFVYGGLVLVFSFVR